MGGGRVMELTVALTISMIGCIIGVASFVLNRKDKATSDSSSDAYHLGQIDTKLKNIEDVLNKIENKLDDYDKEIKKEIKIALENHVAIYHKQ